MKQDTTANLSFIEPMNALQVRELPVGNWIYELKFDGYRALAFKAGKEVRLVSRNRTNFNNDYPQVVDSLRSLRANEVIIDGEITALDEKGKSSFQLLQSYGTSKQIPLVYHAFDLLSLDGTDLCSRPLIERRKVLAKLLGRVPDNIRFSEDLRGNREDLLKVARQFRLEGLMAKRPDSLYESGRRSGSWVKSQTDSATGVCHRRLHITRRQSQILRLFACRLPRSGRALVRRQGRHRLL